MKKPKKKLLTINIISLFLFLLITILVKYTKTFTNINLYFNSIFNSIQIDILVKIYKLIAFIFDAKFLIVITLLLSFFIWKKYSKNDAIFFTLTMIFNGIIIFLLKSILKIERPLNILETSFSFPSGHATTAVVFFGLLSYFLYKNFKIKSIYIPIFMVLFISFTRLYLGVHWISDILGGIVLGIFILTLSILLQDE